VPFRGAEEGETIKKVLAPTQFSLPLWEPEGLTENRVESGSCSNAGGTALEMGSPGPQEKPVPYFVTLSEYLHPSAS